jgi:signal transduction histidine kinase
MPNQLNQVFMNLLVNAGHAIPGNDGLIRIKTWATEDHIHISIKDNGVGIPRENLRKIFEPFFTTKEVGQGTGLGLSLVFDIIKKHDGHIEAFSEENVGTEFRISLPLGGVEDE